MPHRAPRKRVPRPVPGLSGPAELGRGFPKDHLRADLPASGHQHPPRGWLAEEAGPGKDALSASLCGGAGRSGSTFFMATAPALGLADGHLPCRAVWLPQMFLPFKTTSMFTASKKWELPTCHPWMEGHTKGSIRTVECDSATKGGGALTPHSLDEPGRHVVRGAGRRGPQMSPLM
ncbi:PREDICTED: uncharacterized protein C7orf50 homolog isoform X3 [Hipposideros armiger]|uniref:Uncharacterized protein C7orf50 homolog isoform X3 n=1 Tax=Hipposideros armiger TaxID=186990 RepID=A0A8B7QZA5_HIPAR|nr:PREDICTED: uncharacterized protein C7orf50 homolog isoform X3 [Hipposideros armiger]